MTILQNLNETLQIPNVCVQIGKYLVNDFNNLEFIIYKDTFQFIVYFLIIRYIIYLTMYIMEKFKIKKLTIRFPKSIFEYYKKGRYTKFERIDVLKWCFDLCILIIEFRLIALVQIIFL